MDVSSLYEVGIGEVIRSFRPITSETVQQVISDFTSGKTNSADLRLCLKAGADVDGFVGGKTALMKAVSSRPPAGRSEAVTRAVQLLVRDGADINLQTPEVLQLGESDGGGGGEESERIAKGSTALMIASKKGEWESASLLVKEKAYVETENGEGETALKIAGQVVNRRFRPDSEAMQTPSGRQKRATAEGLLIDLVKKTPESKVREVRLGCNNLLHFAASYDLRDFAQICLSKRLDINTVGALRLPPLRMASALLHVDLVELFLSHGAEVGVPDVMDGRTALSWVARFRYFDPRERTREETREKAERVVKLLVEHGADINERSVLPPADTPLHDAVRAHAKLRVQVLLDNGADPRVRNGRGENVYQLAARLANETGNKRYREIIELLDSRRRETEDGKSE